MTQSKDINPGDEASPDTKQTGKLPCEVCKGSGKVDNKPCTNCGGSGEVVVIVGDA